MEKHIFPRNFIFGVATAAYQIEGARENLDSCIWDDFAKVPGKVLHQDDGLLACNSYHKIDEDIQILKELHVKAYRFSICWTRIIKDGTGEILPEGIAYYQHILHELKANQITPFVTLYHWDLPSCLQAKGGWENDEIVEWFTYFCKIVFNAFKNDVGYYVTINEPFCIANLGYGNGIHAPGIANLKSQVKVSVNLLKAHGAAVKLYRELGYSGKIGICLNINDVEPINEKAKDVVELIKHTGLWWYYYPIVCGYFPEDAISYFQSKNAMCSISKEDMALITQKTDFIGLNHYNPEYYDETGKMVRKPGLKENSLHWQVEGEGLYRVIKEMSSMCSDKDIMVMENGFSSNSLDKNKEIEDDERIAYYDEYLQAVSKCIKEGIRVKGYFAWSLLDNYEWAYGYSERFGLVYVDYTSKDLKRTIKKSGYYYRDIIDASTTLKLIYEETFENDEDWRNNFDIIISGNGFGNDEDQYYVDSKENLRVEDGVLKIIAKKEKYENRYYTSAKIVSKKAFKYGHFEFVAKLPEGSGAWPAIWMMPVNRSGGWPFCGEIDVMENVGRKKDIIHFSLHTKKYNHKEGTQRTKFLQIPGSTDTFKLYSLDWTDESISFNVDGICYAKFEKNDIKYEKGLESWPFDKEFYLIINLAIGGFWGRPIDERAFPMEFDLKSIKVYSWED